MEGQQVKVNIEAFCQEWHDSHKLHIETLHEALRNTISNCSEEEKKKNEELLLELIHKSLGDYKIYYEMRRLAVEQDSFQVLQPFWKSSLENAFMWMGGWRPSSAFQVALSQDHDQAPPSMSSPVKMSSLTGEQLHKVEVEKSRAKSVEDQISCKAALLQKSIADRQMVKIAQGFDMDYIDAETASAQLKEVMREKIELLCELLLRADALRFECLESMVAILSPIQAAQFLITAEVLKLAFSHVGEVKDRRAAAE